MRKTQFMQLVGILETTNSLLRELIAVEKEKPEPKKIDSDKETKSIDVNEVIRNVIDRRIERELQEQHSQQSHTS